MGRPCWTSFLSEVWYHSCSRPRFPVHTYFKSRLFTMRLGTLMFEANVWRVGRVCIGEIVGIHYLLATLTLRISFCVKQARSKPQTLCLGWSTTFRVTGKILGFIFHTILLRGANRVGFFWIKQSFIFFFFCLFQVTQLWSKRLLVVEVKEWGSPGTMRRPGEASLYTHL